MEHFGFSTVPASNAESALYSFRDYRPPLVISDCHMPELKSTEEMVRAIKSEAPETVILLISADSQLSMKWAKSIGADYFLLKPVPLTTLKDFLMANQLLEGEPKKG